MSASISPAAGGFAGPVKRSLTIAGHPTSLSLEPVFWEALERAAGALDMPINAVVAAIDAQRIMAANPSNLASATRVWLFERAIDASKSQ